MTSSSCFQYHSRSKIEFSLIFCPIGLKFGTGVNSEALIPDSSQKTIVSFRVISYGQSTYIAIRTRTMMFGQQCWPVSPGLNIMLKLNYAIWLQHVD